jgi:hypothetical protein
MTPKLTQEIQEALESVDKLRNEMTYEEWKMRFAEHKERCRLMGLYEKAKHLESVIESELSQQESEEMEAVRSYLEPLDLAPAGTPVMELARLAAQIVMEKDE